MSAIQEILDEMARRGVTARVDGDSLRLKPREVLDDDLLARIREHKQEIVRALLALPVMPPDVRLIAWNLKEPPVGIEPHMIVRDPALFVRMTLGELVERLNNPKRKYGWSIQKMIDHLAQAGVIVALESKPKQ